MTPEQVDRVFGRGRLKMVTGEHVEVFREAVVSGERRRYTKRFLNSTDGDFGHWTEREWKILARLIGHGIGCVPDVVQFDRGLANGPQLVQTYDAGVTVDQWATLLPLYRDGRVFRYAFEDCAHWWALAHYCLKALKDIHELDLVHLDIKGDNVCIPFGPATFDPDVIDAPLYPLFGQLALIDFAFSLVSGENLTVALPIGWQREYDYQSPRLIEALAAGHEGDLRKTRQLDWRCDFYSLAAMLKRYLPGEIATQPKGRAIGWTPERYAAARAMILSLRRHHDAELPLRMPHESLIETTGAMLGEAELAQSLAEGWTLARDVTVASGVASPLTPMTRIAPPVRVFRNPRERTRDAQHEAPDEDNARPAHAVNAPRDPVAGDIPTPALAFAAPTDLRVARMQRGEAHLPLLVTRQDNAPSVQPERRVPPAVPALAVIVTLALGAAVAHQAFPDGAKGLVAGASDWFGNDRRNDAPSRHVADGNSAAPSAAAENVAKAAAPDPGGSAATSSTAPASTASSDNAAAPDAAKPASDERTQNATAAASTDATNAAPPTSSTKPDPSAVAPLSKPGRRAAPSYAETPPKTAGKRPPVSASSTPSTRPMPSSPATPATASKAAPNRYAMVAPRGSAASAGSYGGPASSAEKSASAWTSQPSGGAQIETAPAPPVHIIELAPPANRLANAESAAAPAEKPALANAPTIAQQQETARTSEAPPSPRSSTARRSRPLAADEEWRAGLNALAQFFGFAKRKSAPIEDRGFQEVAPAKPSRTPQSSIASQDRAATAGPRTDVQTLTAPPAVVSTMPRADTPPSVVSPPMVSTPPTALASSPVTLPSMSPAPAPPPVYGEPRTDLRNWERVRETDYATEARRALAQSVPRIAMQTQSEIAAVLAAAARAQDPRAERDVIDAAQAVWVRDGGTALPTPAEAATARRLNEQAMQAYWVRRNIPEAFDLGLKAFGANPNDPEVVGNLAFLHLRMTPSQPETARQLALHAIAVRGTKYRSGRLEDWNTYALASALTGHDIDARNAMYVTVALAGSVERNCKAGLSAMANYGERVREPVEAMLYRIHAQGRAYDSPYCAWPPNWSTTGMRRQ